MLKHMPDENLPSRTVKLFQNGRNQAVRIPREFELPGQDAIMRKDGTRLILEPIAPKSLLALLATLAPIDDDFAPISELPIDDVQL
jgi:antitoxin VapB